MLNITLHLIPLSLHKREEFEEEEKVEWLSEDYMKTYFSREKAVVSQIHGDEWESALKYKGCDSIGLLVLREPSYEMKGKAVEILKSSECKE